MNKFTLTDKTLGYVTVEDATNTDHRYLVAGSRNVVVDRNKKIKIRNGYSYVGAANTDLYPIRSAQTWQTSSGSERPMRVYDDELEVYLGMIDGTDIDAWTRVAQNISTTAIVRFAPWYNDTETLDELLFVQGDDNLYRWNGAVCVVDSITATTITKKGTATFGESRFYATANKIVVCVRTGTEYTYTGGESTTTLTGVADTTGLQAGDVLVQKIITNTDEPVADRKNNTIFVFENQVFLGSDTDQKIYISKNTDPTNYSYSSPRVAGEGGLLTLDGTSKGFGTLGDIVVIFAGNDSIFRAEYVDIAVSTTLAESLKVKKLASGTDQGAVNPESIVQINDAIAYISNEPALRFIQTPSEFGGINPKTLSNQVKPDFDDEDWSNVSALWYKNALYVAAPTNGHLYVLEYSEDADGTLRRFWQCPQLMPVRALSIIAGDLIGHSNSVPESYKLFDGFSDTNSFNEKLPVNARAVYAYHNYGDRSSLKNFDEYFVEGEIGASTKLYVDFLFDFGGKTDTATYAIRGDDYTIVEETVENASLGQQQFGIKPLGGALTAPSNAAKFRVVLELPKVDFHELQVVFYSSQVDQFWSVLAHGPAIELSNRQNTFIKQ